MHRLFGNLIRWSVAAIGALWIISVQVQAGPTPEEYVEYVGKGAKIVPPGQLKLGNYRMSCGRRPTVIDNSLDDYGAAYPGFLILNMKLMNKIPEPVRMWIYSHECAHQFRGPNEEVADCFAVQRGRRRRWLSLTGLEQVCKFISPATGDSMHFSGSERCEQMRKCFRTKKVF